MGHIKEFRLTILMCCLTHLVVYLVAQFHITVSLLNSILDPIMLITGIQSVFEPRGELVAPNCEILNDFQGFW